LFFVTAILYAAVGFGGGSTYNALLVISDLDFWLIPIIALICNLIVVTGNSIRYQQKQLIPWSFSVPIIAVSVPAAFFAGTIKIGEPLFILILGISLFISGLAMIIRHDEVNTPSEWVQSKRGIIVNLLIGIILGFIAGFVGIGGGILFAPILHLQKCLPSKQIAAFASVFIFFNSIAGLSGQLTKQTAAINMMLLSDYIGLFLAVLIGGQLGSRLGTQLLPGILVRRITGALVIYVGVRMLLILIG